MGANRNGMGGHTPHGQHDASDARFVAYQGKAATTSRGRECGDNKRGGKPAALQPANH